MKQSHFKYPRVPNKTDGNLTLFRKIFPPILFSPSPSYFSFFGLTN